MQQQEHTQPDQPEFTATQQTTPLPETRELSPGVTTNPRVLVGKPVIAGTRIPVEKITGALFAGDTIEDIMYDYTLTREQIRDALHYAHVLVEADAQTKIAEATARDLTPGVVSNPRVLVGKPIIEGRRITVELIMDNLAAGRSIDNIMSNYGLTAKQVRDALGYAQYLLSMSAKQD